MIVWMHPYLTLISKMNSFEGTVICGQPQCPISRRWLTWEKKTVQIPGMINKDFWRRNKLPFRGIIRVYHGLSGLSMVYPRFIHGLSMVYYGLTKIVNPKFLAFSVYPPLWVNQWEAKSQGAGFQSGECHHQIGTWLSVLHYLLQNCKGLKNERAIKPSDKNTMKVMIY